MTHATDINLKKLQIDSEVRKRLKRLSRLAFLIRALTTFNLIMPALGVLSNSNALGVQDKAISTIFFAVTTVFVGLLAYLNSIATYQKEVLTRYRSVQMKLGRYAIAGCKTGEFRDLCDIVDDIEISDAIHTEPSYVELANIATSVSNDSERALLKQLDINVENVGLCPKVSSTTSHTAP